MKSSEETLTNSKSNSTDIDHINQSCDSETSDFKDNGDQAQIILEQWRTCVYMANQISKRRDTMNNLFITINLSLVTAISLIWQYKSIIIMVSAIMMCLLWYCLINYYRKLNSSKYKVILAIEEQLPLRPFKEEWKLFKNSSKKEGTEIERYLPFIFIGLYGLLFFAIMIGGTDIQ